MIHDIIIFSVGYVMGVIILTIVAVSTIVMKLNRLENANVMLNRNLEEKDCLIKILRHQELPGEFGHIARIQVHKDDLTIRVDYLQCRCTEMTQATSIEHLAQLYIEKRNDAQGKLAATLYSGS
jgi:hypothetical protein